MSYFHNTTQKTMIEITADVEQYDCPFVDVSAEYDVAFSSINWEYAQNRNYVNARFVVKASTQEELTESFQSLDSNPHLQNIKIIKINGTKATIHTQTEETKALKAVKRNDGFITGPFFTKSGTETWHIGFDWEHEMKDVLGAMRRNNEVRVTEKQELTEDELALIQNAGAAMTLIQGTQELSNVERETIEQAVLDGYFKSPRDADLGDLADEFNISKPSVSETLRRGERKLLSRVVDAIDELES